MAPIQELLPCEEPWSLAPPLNPELLKGRNYWVLFLCDPLGPLVTPDTQKADIP